MFKAGDKVICRNHHTADGKLNLNSIYTVENCFVVNWGFAHSTPMVRLKEAVNNCASHGGYRLNRFEICAHTLEEFIIKL